MVGLESQTKDVKKPLRVWAPVDPAAVAANIELRDRFRFNPGSLTPEEYERAKLLADRTKRKREQRNAKERSIKLAEENKAKKAAERRNREVSTPLEKPPKQAKREQVVSPAPTFATTKADGRSVSKEAKPTKTVKVENTPVSLASTSSDVPETAVKFPEPASAQISTSASASTSAASSAPSATAATEKKRESKKGESKKVRERKKRQSLGTPTPLKTPKRSKLSAAQPAIVVLTPEEQAAVTQTTLTLEQLSCASQEDLKELFEESGVKASGKILVKAAILKFQASRAQATELGASTSNAAVVPQSVVAPLVIQSVSSSNPTPAPVTKTSAPVTKTPALVTQALAPAAKTPVPTTKTSALVAKTPAPTTATPTPAKVPAPAISTPSVAKSPRTPATKSTLCFLSRSSGDEAHPETKEYYCGQPNCSFFQSNQPIISYERWRAHMNKSKKSVRKNKQEH